MSGVGALLLGQGASAGGGALAASPSALFFYGSIGTPGTAQTANCTMTASGGTAPYSYAWALQSGDANTTISSATSSTVSWSRTFGAALQIQDSYWSCTVTDAVGAHAVAPVIHVQLERY